MKKSKETMSEEEVKSAREGRLDMQHLLLIEGNPATEEDIAMFEMFERERWSHARRLAYILEQARARIAASEHGN